MRTVFCAAALLCLAAISVPGSFAQVATGTIEGVVRDSSGGIVPNATVTVQNVDTNQTRTLTTNEAGEYRAPALQVGHYTVKVEKDGFRTLTQQGLTLEVQQELVVNADMQVGTATQEVTVTAEAPIVNTTNGTLGGLVTEEKMADLPLNGRNYIDLSLMQTGVTEDRAQKGDGGVAGVYYSSNGSGPWSNYYTIDGASMANGLGGSSGSAAGTTLGVDGIKEYKVISGSFSAEYGMAMGSQMVIVSKSGGNRFNGDVFEYVRNSIFDARNFFDYTYLTPGEPRLPHLVRNNFGAAFGGPIRRNKTFFYGVYEGLRQKQGITVVDVVPGAGCHPTGASAANNFGAGTIIWNGQGTQPAGSTGPCTQLGNNPSAAIPSAACPAVSNCAVLNSTTAPLLALFPTPLTSLGPNQWTFPTSDPLRVDFAQLRIDQLFSASDTGFVRYNFDRDVLNNSVTNSGSANPAFPQFVLANYGFDQFITVGENHVFSSSLLTTARLSYSRLTQISYNLFPQGDAALTGPQYSFVAGLPVGPITVGGLSTIGPLGSKPADNSTATFSIANDWYYTRGGHSIKFGTLLNRVYFSLISGSGTNGALSFTSLANFLTANYQTYSMLLPDSDTNRYYAMNTMGLYIQDDWRVSPRLTLNLGFRYEPDFGLNELNGKQYAWRGIVSLKPATLTPGPIMNNPSYKNFSPRVGFAYDLTGRGRTSIRGAFGVYYDIANLGSAVRETASGMPPLRKAISVSNSTTAPVALGPLPFVFAGKPIGVTGQGLDYDSKQPYNMQYNITVEQQLPSSIGVSVSYVGMRGIHLFEKADINPTLPTSFDANGYPFWTPTAAQPANCGNAIVAPLTGYCRLNPNLASYNDLQSRGQSYYNALQVVVQKRISHGLQFQTAFTWSQSLDYTENMSGDSSSFAGCGNPTSPLDRSFDKGPSCFNIPINLRVNVLYHLPNMKSGGFGSKFVNGWWVSSIVSAQSGYPLTPLLSTNRSLSATSTNGADRVNINTAASIAASGFPNTCTSLPGAPAAGANPCQYTPIPYDRSKVITGNPQNDINTAMFSLGPVGTLGNAPRDFLRSSPFNNWDFSIAKDTPVPHLGENASIQLRAEFFNILNHANLGVPSGALFTGATKDKGPYSETPIGFDATHPNGTTGQITSTFNASRQIQLALKLIF